MRSWIGVHSKIRLHSSDVRTTVSASKKSCVCMFRNFMIDIYMIQYKRIVDFNFFAEFVQLVFCAVTGKSLSQFPRKYYDLRFRGTVVAHRTEPLIKFMTKEFGVPRWATPPRLHHLCPPEKTKGNEAISSNGKYISTSDVQY